MLSFCMYLGRHAQSAQNKNFAYLCNISSKTWWMKLIFCQQINTKALNKLIVPRWMCVARHARGTENKFTISMQYLKEKVKDEVYFLLADKKQRFLQIDTIIFGVCG